MKEPTTTFAKHLRRTIKDRGMTQKQLAECANIPECTLSRYCTGERTPGLWQMYHICMALHISMDVFIFEVISLNRFRNEVKIYK